MIVTDPPCQVLCELRGVRHVRPVRILVAPAPAAAAAVLMTMAVVVPVVGRGSGVSQRMPIIDPPPIDNPCLIRTGGGSPSRRACGQRRRARGDHCIEHRERSAAG